MGIAGAWAVLHERFGKLLAFLLPLFLLFSKRKTVSTTPAAMRRGPPVEDKGMKESWVRILDAGSQK